MLQKKWSKIVWTILAILIIFSMLAWTIGPAIFL